MLVGNKCDLEDSRQVKKSDAKDFRKKEKLKMFIETSAKDATNVDQGF